MNAAGEYPRIRISGGPRDRGLQYGAAARDRIERSRQGYEQAFRSSVGWSWERAVESVAHLVAPVQEAFPQYLQEMEGIADGASIPFTDVFTMNARTEVIWAATVREADNERAKYARECSAFALLPARTASGHTYLGQNWDWLAHSFDSLVILEVEQDDKPNFVTIVEAGLLAKASMNSSGLGVAVNALVTSADRADPGVPFHVLIRAFADCDSMADAVYVASKNRRASSGNYLLAHSDGLAVNLETTPGDYRGVSAQLPSNGAIVHTNHFVTPTHGPLDVGHFAMADSLIRLQRVQTSIAEAKAPATITALRLALADHADFPAAVCCHPDPRQPEADQWATVMSVVMDLDARTLHLADGNPCSHDYRVLTFEGLLDKPSPWAELRASVTSGAVSAANR